MLGKTAAALTAIDQQGGQVFIDGEYWNAVSQTPAGQGGGGRKLWGCEGLTSARQT